MHTKDFLAAELRKAGLTTMADKAATGYYHDFLSPLDTPEMQLAHDLTTYVNAPNWPRREEASALLDRHMKGEFDASQEESKAWAMSNEGRDAFASLSRERASSRKDHPLGDAPIEEAYRAKMNAVASALDEVFNGDAKGKDREIGFVLLVSPFGDGNDGHRCNFISNGIDREDIVVLFKEMIARFEGQPEMSGHA